MARTVGIGIQDFRKIIENQYFYVDKTAFIKEWWESGDEVTLITRPRRFGKTLAMSMTEQFFSVKYAGRGDLFEGLFIWQEEKYRAMQEAYVHGYWEELVAFTRSMFNAAFKTNPWLESHYDRDPHRRADRLQPAGQ